jgi:hypothetical protein
MNKHGVGEWPHSGFSPSAHASAHAVSRILPKLHQLDNSNHTKQSTALFRAPTTWTCHLANQRGALSHAQQAGSVYKAVVWSTRDSVLDASLSYGYNRISITSKISTDRPGSDPVGRPLIHPRNHHNPTGSKPSTASRPEWPAGFAAEAIPIFRKLELVTRLGKSSTSNYLCGGGISP